MLLAEANVLLQVAQRLLFAAWYIAIACLQHPVILSSGALPWQVANSMLQLFLYDGSTFLPTSKIEQNANLSEGEFPNRKSLMSVQ